MGAAEMGDKVLPEECADAYTIAANDERTSAYCSPVKRDPIIRSGKPT
jgi:hypothetical protein